MFAKLDNLVDSKPKGEKKRDQEMSHARDLLRTLRTCKAKDWVGDGLKYNPKFGEFRLAHCTITVSEADMLVGTAVCFWQTLGQHASIVCVIMLWFERQHSFIHSLSHIWQELNMPEPEEEHWYQRLMDLAAQEVKEVVQEAGGPASPPRIEDRRAADLTDEQLEALLLQRRAQSPAK
jgi:hypothetical protein